MSGLGSLLDRLQSMKRNDPDYFPVFTEAVRTLSADLAHNTDAVVREFFPQAQRTGSYYHLGSVAGEKGDHLAIHRTGARAGKWTDYKDGSFGDLIDLYMASRSVKKSEALNDLSRWLIGQDFVRRDTVAPAAPAAQEPDNRTERMGYALWMAGRRLVGTLGEEYHTRRGLAFNDFNRVRFHPEVPDGETGQRRPAVLYKIIDPTGRMVALQCILLDPNTPTLKAPLKYVKKQFGKFRQFGGYVPIQHRPTARVQILSEGVEDGIALSHLCPALSVRAVLAQACFLHLEHDDRFKHVIVAAHRDTPEDRWGGMGIGEFRAREFAARIMAEFPDVTVKVLLPPEGIQDWNDGWRADPEAARGLLNAI